MAYEGVLRLVKARLNRLSTDTSLDEYLQARIEGAAAELRRAGICLADEDIDDMMLLADYSVWRYQNRDAPGAMPEWLRLARRERWLQGKDRNDDTG